MFQNTNLLVGRKKCFSVHMTRRLRDAVEEDWNFKKFPLRARKKVDSSNPKLRVFFPSFNDYVVHLLRVNHLKGKYDFDFDMQRNNPDHPDFPEVQDEAKS